MIMCSKLLSLAIFCCLSIPSIDLKAQEKINASLKQNQSAQKKISPVHALTARQVFEKYQNCVYTLKTNKSTGTGFLTPLGMITCFHVIEGATKIEALQPGKEPLILSHISGFNKEADIACLVVPYQLRTKQSVTLSFSGQDDVAVGDPVFVIGSPQGLENTLTEGLLSAKRVDAGKNLLQLSAAISKGSSGSPVFTNQGKVVGMVTSFLAEGQQLNFALSMESILGMLPEGVPISLVLTGSSPATHQAGDQKIEGLSDLTVKKIIELNTSKKKHPLYGLKEIYLLVEGISSVQTFPVTQTDIRNWVEAELTRSSPKLKVFEAKAERGKQPVANVWDVFCELDRVGSNMYVQIGLMYDDVTGYTFYTCNIECQRPVWSVGGDTKASVWRNGSYGFFGKKNDGEKIIRELIQKIVSKFSDEWIIANKE